MLLLAVAPAKTAEAKRVKAAEQKTCLRSILLNHIVYIISIKKLNQSFSAVIQNDIALLNNVCKASSAAIICTVLSIP